MALTEEDESIAPHFVSLRRVAHRPTMWEPFPILIDLDDMNYSADPHAHSRQQTHLALDELAVFLLRLEVSQPDKLMRIRAAIASLAAFSRVRTHLHPSRGRCCGSRKR